MAEPVKSGKKTTEFWVTMVVTVLGALLAALGALFPQLQDNPDAVPEWVRIASVLGGAAMSALAQLGYANSRAKVKAAEAEGKAMVEASRQEALGLMEAAASKHRQQGRTSTLLVGAVALVGLLLLPACNMTLLKHDPVTVEQIQKTIEHERATQAFVEGKLAGPDEIEFDVVSDAEIARLEAWLAAEEAKKLEDAPEEE